MSIIEDYKSPLDNVDIDIEIKGTIDVSGHVKLDLVIDKEMFMKLPPTVQSTIIRHLGQPFK